MKLDDVEKELRDAKLDHLTEDELDSYSERNLDDISQVRAEAHLKLCLICERRLNLLKDESAAMERSEVDTEDAALVRQMMHQRETDASEPVPDAERIPVFDQERYEDMAFAENIIEIGEKLPLQNRLAAYISQLVANWQASLTPSRPAHRGANAENEIWRWRSDDGLFRAWVVLEDNSDLTIHLSSREPEMQGVRLRARLGGFSCECTFARRSESQVYARLALPEQNWPGNLADISIEVV